MGASIGAHESLARAAKALRPNPRGSEGVGLAHGSGMTSR